jgi:hypothetical protein
VKYLSKILKNQQFIFAIWAFAAAFLCYASMYAFRKPFNAATFEGLQLMGFDLIN